MSSKFIRRTSRLGSLAGACFATIASLSQAADRDAARDIPTASPIKHVIVVIGENSSFDHAFATYIPRHREDGIWNLLSRGIVDADGRPSWNFRHAQQFSVTPQPLYYIHPPAGSKTPYGSSNSANNPLPTPDLNGVPLGQSDTGAPFTTPAAAAQADPELTLNPDRAVQAHNLLLMTTGFANDPDFQKESTSQIRNPDLRISGVSSALGLPNGPFQLTANSQNGGAGLPYDSYTEDTIHRFFQMWQMMDCDISQATRANPSGCLLDLMPFVTSTFAGAVTLNGVPNLALYTGPTEEGSGTPLAFFNMQQGDAPYLKHLADEYTISDNMHQAVIGGTGANHIMLGTGDVYYFSDGKGKPVPAPSAIPAAAVGLPIPGATVSLIANPNPVVAAQTEAKLQAALSPVPFTDPNLYTNDVGAALGEYVNCSDATQPGVAPILNYLAQFHLASRCAANTFYAINNFFPGFHANGVPAGAAAVPAADGSDTFFIPPQTLPTIGDALQGKGVSWHYYGDGFNDAVAGKPNQFCPICNPMQYSASIMTGPGKANNKDVVDFFADVAANTLPAVSFVKPSGFVDGHPQSSKLDLFEAFVKNIVDAVNRNPELAADTAIMITWDESGGFYDSGYIQPVDFFGDAPRIPFIVVSPFTRGGHVNHSYADHVSVTKFIERNWRLGHLSTRSRDNLPNPIARRRGDFDFREREGDFAAPYIPVNGPAISDLFDLFGFDQDRDER
jgi:phospholipase C